MELEFGSVSFWEEGKTLYPPQRFPMGIPISISNNGKTESAQGTMKRGKRWEKASLLCSPSHRASRAPFSFSPASPLRHKEASSEERGENQQKNTSSEQEWKVVMTDGVYIRDQNPEYFIKKSRSVSFQLGYNFVVASFVFEDLLNWISSATARKTSVCLVHLGLWAPGWEDKVTLT